MGVLDEEWVWRTDGAPTTDIEALKGGISGAIKRVAVQFGMGAYLYGSTARRESPAPLSVQRSFSGCQTHMVSR